MIVIGKYIGGNCMEELVPVHLISQIFKLNLSAKIIADKKDIFPIIVRGKVGKIEENQFQIQMKLEKDSIERYHQFMIELKGNIDIESLRYAGNVTLERMHGESDYYKMKVLNLYKLNQRQYRRVPYRRLIQIIEPIKYDAILLNISASGALIECERAINGNEFKMGFTLAKKYITLSCVIVDQFLDEKEQMYKIRCYFDPINKGTQKLIKEVVKQITYMAKNRLRAAQGSEDEKSDKDKKKK